MATFSVYGKPGCVWCKRAIALIEMNGHRHDYLDITTHSDEFEFDFPDAKSVPKIVLEDWVNIKFESYEELQEYFNKDRNRIDVA